MSADAPNGRTTIVVGLFKLHLSDTREEDKPPLPMGLDYRKCIVDYFSEMKKIIKTTLDATWPADAAAAYCISSVKQLPAGENFMVVDCGGGMVDLTIRKLTSDGKSGEIIRHVNEVCGSTFVDKGFIRLLCEKFGLFEALQQLQTYHYEQMQYLVQEFSVKVKFSFTGDPSTFKPIDIDLEDCCPSLLNYATGDVKKNMEKLEWLVELNFEDVKAMFDSVIQSVIFLIGNQISPDIRCVALFLVGGFSESLYFQRRVRETFQHYFQIIEVPKQPITAVVRGAVQYVANKNTMRSRILKYTYGVQVTNKWKKGDPPQRKTPEGLMYVFHTLVKRGTEVKVDQVFGYIARPSGPYQKDMTFDIYASSNPDVRFCDEPGNRYLGTLKVDLSDIKHGGKKLIEFSLTFGATKIKAAAKDKKTGRTYHASLSLDF
ncbi:11746_t:CDS:2 [Acaulospora colombiana]|uniref:11746_t:CDS:1 n=1 Tax=Acaulospora colombiana TaxID=27376 RepID=A0ACA9KT58_9GLOM|nr:11746_t:CDS:2 [Acaulospora colombiana]